MGLSKPTSTPHVSSTSVCDLWASNGDEMVSLAAESPVPQTRNRSATLEVAKSKQQIEAMMTTTQCRCNDTQTDASR